MLECGLGTYWTTLRFPHEQEADKFLGIPYDDVMQVALIPDAQTVGDDFSAGPRKLVVWMVPWEQW